MKSFRIGADRHHEFSMGDRKVVMLLSKNQNPVSYDQSISYILRQTGEKTVLTYVNNINHTNSVIPHGFTTSDLSGSMIKLTM